MMAMMLERQGTREQGDRGKRDEGLGTMDKGIIGMPGMTVTMGTHWGLVAYVLMQGMQEMQS